VALLESDDPEALAMRLTLGEALLWEGDVRSTDMFLQETRAIAERQDDARSAARAETLRMHSRVSLGFESMRQLEEDASRLRGELAALGDTEGAGLAGLEVAKLRFWNGRIQSALDLARELLPAAGQGRLGDDLRGWIAGFAYWGPTPAPEAIELAERMASEMRNPRQGANRTARQIGALLAMQGRFAEARAKFEEQRTLNERLGSSNLLGSLKSHHMAPAERLAGDAPRAAELAVSGYEALTALGDRGFASTSAVNVARAMLDLGRDDEAEQWARTGQQMTTEDDLATQGPARGVLALVLAHRGEYEAAERLAREAVVALDQTDSLVQVADGHADLATVLRAAGKAEEAEAEFQRALELYERKGHLVGAEQMRARLAEVTGTVPPAEPAQT
jgi:tetratricopeptide (TPR) repeat protein